MADPASPQTLFYSSLDLWRDAAFGSVGWRYAPDGLDSGGLLLLIEGKSGVSSFRSGTYGGDWVDRQVNGGGLGVGWTIKQPDYVLTFTGALAVEDHRLLPDDPGAKPRGTRTGFAATAELWWQPQAEWMLSGQLSLSSIGDQWWGRLAPGWRLLDAAWIGPELTLSGDRDDTATRLGGHITGLKLFNNEWRLSGGHTFSGQRQGAYGTLAMWRRW